MKKIKDLEKEYNVSINANPNLNVATWLERQGLKSLAKALRIIDKKLK